MEFVRNAKEKVIQASSLVMTEGVISTRILSSGRFIYDKEAFPPCNI